MSDWKDLEIGNIQEFVENEVIPQKYIDGEWFTRIDSLKSSIVYDIVEPSISSKYRYKLKPLKPCVITEHMANDLRTRVVNANYNSLEDLYGRPVEIIKDGE